MSQDICLLYLALVKDSFFLLSLYKLMPSSM